KGVIITTSEFTAEARDYVRTISTRIVLIGGAQLVNLMIDHGVGVRTVDTYVVRKIDGDYFEDA
ncbi:MAG: restriction endonuclease, partial [Chloroflexi bacterium]|nr:restriction endonuclease [Chloroflexota bacterium]